MKHLHLYEQFDTNSEIKELIKIELENDLTVDVVELRQLLKGINTVTLTIDIEWNKEALDFDTFRNNTMSLIERKLSHIGRKYNFRISLPSKDEWYKKWVFDYSQYTNTLKVSFYLIYKSDETS